MGFLGHRESAFVISKMSKSVLAAFCFLMVGFLPVWSVGSGTLRWFSLTLLSVWVISSILSYVQGPHEFPVRNRLFITFAYLSVG